MIRTYRVDTSKKWIDTLRHSPLRSFRQAESRYHLDELGEALLDFTQMGDLLTWLDGNV